MTTQLRWSNKARTDMLPAGGSFKDGDARWCGYVDVAKHIAGNPKGFTPVDVIKAHNILTAEGMLKLVLQLEEACDGKELASRRS